MQIRFMMTSLFGALALGGTVFAANDSAANKAQVTLSAEEIATVMRDAGYSMTEFESEDREVEAEGDQDGASWEVVINGQTGAILSVEQDD